MANGSRQVVFISLKINLGWKCLWLLPSQWLPFNCSQPWTCVCASSEARLGSLCSVECYPPCLPCPFCHMCHMALLLNFPWPTWPRAHSNLNLPSIPPHVPSRHQWALAFSRVYAFSCSTHRVSPSGPGAMSSASFTGQG